jgi:hypothetical protein
VLWTGFAPKQITEAKNRRVLTSHGPDATQRPARAHWMFAAMLRIALAGVRTGRSGPSGHWQQTAPKVRTSGEGVFIWWNAHSPGRVNVESVCQSRTNEGSPARSRLAAN